MASFGKKILSAFVDLTPDEKPATPPEKTAHYAATPVPAYRQATDTTEKFKQYFEKLFSEANIPGPDYFEFSKMTDAMSAIPDEKARFAAAFAGLNVQGLNKGKLLDTAAEYLRLLEQDAANFNQSVDAAVQEKVAARQQEISAKQQRIEQLKMEISDLQNKVQLLQLEVKESEEKIESNTGGYKVSSQQMRQRIEYDIDRIKQYING